MVHEAILTVALNMKYHPVKEYLENLKWDGNRRLDTWSSVYLMTDNTEFTRAVAAKWLISAVARVMVPSIKADHMLILEGDQDFGKSTTFKIMGDPWFLEDLGDIGDKDTVMQLAGTWIAEIAELEAMRRAEVSRLKAFLTRRNDRYRPPWGRHVIDQQRQTVFGGTINPDGNGYLLDSTGGRRFWPIRCHEHVRLDDLARDRDQLWAEAYQRYMGGEVFFIDDPALKEVAQAEQSMRQQDDAWDSLISGWLFNRPVVVETVSTAEILSGLGIPKDKWTRSEQLRVAAYLNRTGWERFHKRVGRELTWRYRRKETTEH
jgi:predicted P-loop ATPase